jgi:hypothetical protein
MNSAPWRTQDLRSRSALRWLFGKHHDDETARSDIVDVPGQMLVFLDRSGGANQRPLEPRQKSVLCAGRIQTIQVVFAMQYVDFVPLESGLRESLDRGRTSFASSIVPTTRSVGYGMKASFLLPVSGSMISAADEVALPSRRDGWMLSE